MKFTKIEKKVILSANKDNDYCTIAHKNTMNSLVNKNIAKFTSGFGYKFGAIIELTEKGKNLHNVFLEEK